MKIKKFLVMVSLLAFVLANVIPVGVFAVGENQRAPLPPSGGFNEQRFRDSISNFITLHEKWYENLSNREFMKEEGELELYNAYIQIQSGGQKFKDDLGFIYSVISPSRSWFTSEYVPEFAGSSLDLHDNWLGNKAVLAARCEDYFGIIQSIFTSLCKKYPSATNLDHMLNNITYFHNFVQVYVKNDTVRKELLRYYNAVFNIAIVFHSTYSIAIALDMDK
ncbi:MAG: hypothetical protein Q4D57_00625 [Clostridia bacterium]|nr:hypothetical protein [Clostridia bacterium]